MKIFSSSDNPYDLVNDDGLDCQIPVHPEEAFDHGIRFSARYVGSLDVPKPASRVEIVAAMRRVRFQFKTRSIPKRDVFVVVSTEGIRVCDRDEIDEENFTNKRRKLFHWMRKRRSVGRTSDAVYETSFDWDMDLSMPGEQHQAAATSEAVDGGGGGSGGSGDDASNGVADGSGDGGVDPKSDASSIDRRRRRHLRPREQRRHAIMESPINRVFYVSHDSQDLKTFSYIAQENEADAFSPEALFRCHVFKSHKQLEAMRIVRTIGQAFEVCHKINKQRQQLEEQQQLQRQQQLEQQQQRQAQTQSNNDAEDTSCLDPASSSSASSASSSNRAGNLKSSPNNNKDGNKSKDTKSSSDEAATTPSGAPLRAESATNTTSGPASGVRLTLNPSQSVPVSLSAGARVPSPALSSTLIDHHLHPQHHHSNPFCAGPPPTGAGTASSSPLDAFSSYDQALDRAFDRVFDNYHRELRSGGVGGGGGGERGDGVGSGDDPNFDPNFDQPYSLISHGDTTYRNDSRFDFDVNDILEMDELENMKTSSLQRHFRLMRIELVTLKEERAGAEVKMKNLESLLAAERRTRAEEEERVKNLTRINGMLLMQVRSLTKEMDSFSLTAKSGENPFETKSYDDGFQSANSFFSGGSQTHLDDQAVLSASSSSSSRPPIPATMMTTTTTTSSTKAATAASIPSSATFPLDDSGKHRRSFPPASYRPKDGLSKSEVESTDENLYESQGDVSPDSALQTSLA